MSQAASGIETLCLRPSEERRNLPDRPTPLPVPTFTTRLADAAAACGIVPGERLVVAASAGVDSTVLFYTLRAFGVDAVAVYVHHGLRAAADAEAEHVRAMAVDSGAEALVIAAPVPRGNRQAAARAARYAALSDAARRCGAAAVATGHTATDQAETVLMALVRGAGLRGLGGMPERRALAPGIALVRPLLWATRAEVEAHARAQGWTWLDDDSNATDAYRRNRVRHGVLPLLDAEGGPQTAARIAEAARGVRDALDAGPAATFVRLAVPDARGVSLGLDALRALSGAARGGVLAEALRWAGATRSRAAVARTEALLGAVPGRRVAMGTAMAWRDRDRIRIVVDAAPDAPVAVGPNGATTRSGRLERLSAGASDGVLFDASALAGPLVLRPWRAGDRIAVRGAERLVSGLLTDARVPPSERPEALVLTCAGRLVWLVGHALADGARVSAADTERFVWYPAPPLDVGTFPYG